MKKITALLLLFLPLQVIGEYIESPSDAKQSPVAIEILGYIKTDFFGDTRFGNTERDGHSYNFPLRCIAPCNGDINKHGQVNILSIETNFGFKLTTPDLLGTEKNSGVILADFWGSADFSIDTLRLKYGYLDLDWGKHAFLFGQIDHMLYIPECTTGVIAYNNGSPMEPQIYSPQFRYTLRHDCFEARVAGASQVMDQLSFGPIGPSTLYIRDSLMPNFTFDFRCLNESYVVGGAVDVKRLVPRVVNSFNCRVKESIVTTSAQIYGRIDVHNCRIANKFMYASNLTECGLLGGYAVRTRSAADVQTYSPIRSLCWWTDVSRIEGIWQPGIFMGIAKNIGSPDRLYIDPATNQPVTFAFGPDVEYVLKIMPRLKWVCSQITCALEGEYSQARYGRLNDFADVIPTQKPVHNMRIDFAAYYFF